MDDPAGQDCPESRLSRKRPSQTATQRALGLLARREHSRKELVRKLVARGVPPDEVEAAIDRLSDAGWQDDARFAESLARGRAANGYGPRHIRAELGLHGLDDEAIAAAMATCEGDWVGLARDLVRRRFGKAGLEGMAKRRKAAELLARRGFDGETIRVATRFDPDEHDLA